ncbi:MAG TPA: zinc ribbon domain-containing protein [Stenomitos sp.]
MAYIGNLGAGQQVYIENQGSQTLMTLTSRSNSQQQSQSSSFNTGNWTVPPTLFWTPAGYVLRIESSSGQHFVQIQANGMNHLSTVPSLVHADVISLEQVADAASSSQQSIEFTPLMEPMKPMEPLPPMKMGDMEMRMNPMEMRMGNMELRMGEKPQTHSGSRFCSQCGQSVKESDRFCSSCGHRLT